MIIIITWFFPKKGDLVDAFPNEKLREAQISDLKRVFSELDPQIKTVCVCGNHGNFVGKLFVY